MAVVLGRLSPKVGMILMHIGFAHKDIGLISSRLPIIIPVLMPVKITDRIMWSRRIQPTTHKGTQILKLSFVNIYYSQNQRPFMGR
jgi:hypothetical protein